MDVCRLCSHYNDSVNVLDPEFPGADKLLRWIFLATGIEIKKGDLVSSAICHSCCTLVLNMYKYRKRAVQSDKNLKNGCGQVYETANIRLAKLLKALLESNYFYDTFDAEEQLSILNISKGNNLSKNLKKCLQNISDNMYHPSVQKLINENQNLVLPAEIYKNNMSPVVALDNIKADEWYAKQNKRRNTVNSERVSSQNSIGKYENISVRKRVIIYDSDSEDELPKRGRKTAVTELTSDDQMCNNIPAENSSDTTDANVQILNTEQPCEIVNKSKTMERDGEIICLSDDDEDAKPGDFELKLLFQKHYKVCPRPKVVAMYFRQQGTTCLRNMLFELKKHSIPVEFKNSNMYCVQFIKKKSNVRNCSGDMTFWSYEDCIDIDNGVEPTIDDGNALKLFDTDDSDEFVASPTSHTLESSVTPKSIVDTTIIATEISILKKLVTRSAPPRISDAIAIERAENVNNYTNSEPTDTSTNATEQIETFDRTNGNATITETTVHSTNNQSQDSITSETVLQTASNQTDTLPKKRQAKRKTFVSPNRKPKKGEKVANSDDNNAIPTKQSKKLNTNTKSQDPVIPENVVQYTIPAVLLRKKKATKKTKISIMQPLIERLNSKKSKQSTKTDESGSSEVNQFQSEGIGFPKGNKRIAKKARAENARPIVQMTQSQNSTTSEIVPETTNNDVAVKKAIRNCRNRKANISMMQHMKLNTTITSEQAQQCTNTDEFNSLGVSQYQAKSVEDAANSDSTNAVLHAENTNAITNESVVQTTVVGSSEDAQLRTNTKEPNLNKAKIIVFSANTNDPKKPRIASQKQINVTDVNIPALNPQTVAITTNTKHGISILKPIKSFVSEDVQNIDPYKGPKSAGNVFINGGGNATATIPQPIVLNTYMSKTSSNATTEGVIKHNSKAITKLENSVMHPTSVDEAQPANLSKMNHNPTPRNMFVKGTLKSGTFIVNANGKTGNRIKKPVFLKIVAATKNITCSSSTSTSGALASNRVNQDETNKSSNPNMTGHQKVKNAASTFGTSGKSEKQPVTDSFSQAHEAPIQNTKNSTYNFPVTNTITTSFSYDSMPPLLPLFTNAPQRTVLTPIGINTGKHQVYSINGLTTSKVVRKTPSILKRSVSVLRKPRRNLGNAPTNLGNAPTNLGNAPTNLGNAPTNLGNAPTNLGNAPTYLGNAPTNFGNAPTNLGNAPTNLGNAPTNLWYLVPALPVQTVNEKLATQSKPKLPDLLPLPHTQKSQIKAKDSSDRPL